MESQTDQKDTNEDYAFSVTILLRADIRYVKNIIK